MTCVCAVEHGGKVYMGGDSAVSWSCDDAVFVATHRKVIRRGGMLLGLAGNLGTCTVAAAGLRPEPYVSGDPRTHILTAVLLPLRALLAEAKMDAEGCDLLIGCASRIYFAGLDGAVHGFDAGYAAIGSGSSYALGSLHTSRGTPAKRVRQALSAAVAHCASVGGPLYVLSV